MRIIAGLAGVVFIATGSLKLRGMEVFRQAVADHGLVPESLVASFALGFGIVELSLGAAAVILAAIGRTTASLWIGSGLFGVLCLYSAGVAMRPPGGPVPCGCGFGTTVDNWWAMAMRNFVLCAALAALAVWGRFKARNEQGRASDRG